MRVKGLTLRPAVDADLPFLLTLYADVRAGELAAAPWTQAQKDAFLASQFDLQHRHYHAYFPAADYWIVARRGGPIGRLYLDRATPRWRIVDISLVSAVRGRGLGIALLVSVQRLAAAAGAVAIDLTVALRNVDAARLYMGLGFEADGVPTGAHQPMTWRPLPSDRCEDFVGQLTTEA